MTPKSVRIKRRPGDVVEIPLGNGWIGFGRVLNEPLMAFYDLHVQAVPPVDKIVRSPIAFRVCVMNYAVCSGVWPVIGFEPLDDDLLLEPLFYKKDAISGQVSLYRDSTGEETRTTVDGCEGIECAAVWEPDHIVDRLNDRFAGRPNKWVESLRP